MKATIAPVAACLFAPPAAQDSVQVLQAEILTLLGDQHVKVQLGGMATFQIPTTRIHYVKSVVPLVAERFDCERSIRVYHAGIVEWRRRLVQV